MFSDDVRGKRCNDGVLCALCEGAMCEVDSDGGARSTEECGLALIELA